MLIRQQKPLTSYSGIFYLPIPISILFPLSNIEFIKLIDNYALIMVDFVKAKPSS